METFFFYVLKLHIIEIDFLKLAHPDLSLENKQL